MTDALAKLAGLLGGKAVAAEALLARDQPARYAKKFAARMEDRSLDEVDAWIALVDALEARDLGCSIDWKFSAEDIVWNLEQVAKAKQLKDLFAWYDEDAHLKTRTADFIAFAGRALSAHGLALVELHLEGDSYELTLLPWKQLAEAQKLANAIDQEIVSWAPKQPLKKPLPPPKKKPVGKFVSCKLKSGYAHVEERARAKDAVVFAEREATELFDFTRWPPRRELLGKQWIKSVIDGSDGRRLLCGAYLPIADGEVGWQAIGTLRLQSGKKSQELIDEMPAGFEPDHAGFLGKSFVLLPTEPTCRYGKFKRPLMWDGKKMRPAPLPNAKPKGGDASFLRQAFARTGNGEDVLLWEGVGWNEKFKKAFDPGKLLPNFMCDGVPAPGDAFYLLMKNELRLVARGQKPKVVWRTNHVLYQPVVAPDGALLFRCNRYAEPKKPIIIIWRPDRVIEVPPQVLGIRKDDQLDAVGVTNGRLWGVHDNEARSVDWSAFC